MIMKEEKLAAKIIWYIKTTKDSELKQIFEVWKMIEEYQENVYLPIVKDAINEKIEELWLQNEIYFN